ncbi:hypothetical protein Moror_7705 [Moniliophthora roreri MCA 2997]|uniref:Uncharacterized protein n=2 Tax=Moniliophthora roreri TaxID=221103 RepID=V2XBR5_MONRO|nr:hypothetical protein Moror_7705 [Moniliophthora roreri MCA 2997]KAI3613286.1 hypothetical protein WG66_001516 [Moniliophthora roreri]
MGPFKSSKNNSNAAYRDEPISTHNDYTAGTGTGMHRGTGAGNANDPYTHTLPEHTAGATGFGGHQTQPGMNTVENHHNNYPIGGGSSVNSDPYAAAGVGHQTTNIPPSAGMHAGSTGTGEHRGGSMTGKFEKTLGTVLGSDSLKNKGLQKEQEAHALKVQGAELAEAERLEREAAMRRERAVAHGAHPENKHPGAGMYQ